MDTLIVMAIVLLPALVAGYEFAATGSGLVFAVAVALPWAFLLWLNIIPRIY